MNGYPLTGPSPRRGPPRRSSLPARAFFSSELLSSPSPLFFGTSSSPGLPPPPGPPPHRDPLPCQGPSPPDHLLSPRPFSIRPSSLAEAPVSLETSFPAEPSPHRGPLLAVGFSLPEPFITEPSLTLGPLSPWRPLPVKTPLRRIPLLAESPLPPPNNSPLSPKRPKREPRRALSRLDGALISSQMAYLSFRAACAAASRAMGTRKGEQET